MVISIAVHAVGFLNQADSKISFFITKFIRPDPSPKFLLFLLASSNLPKAYLPAIHHSNPSSLLSKQIFQSKPNSHLQTFTLRVLPSTQISKSLSPSLQSHPTQLIPLTTTLISILQTQQCILFPCVQVASSSSLLFSPFFPIENAPKRANKRPKSIRHDRQQQKLTPAGIVRG